MLLDPNRELFDRVPTDFISPFPSRQALLSPRLAALLEQPILKDAKAGEFVKMGQLYLAQAGAQAWNYATQMLWKVKATQVGDIAADLVPKLMWVKNNVPQGILAEVPFLLSTDRSVQLGAMARVGMELALKFASAVPVAGRVLSLVIGIAQVVMEIFAANRDDVQVDTTLRLPWDEYNRDADEEIVKNILKLQVPLPDWTDIFAPPTTAKEWRTAEGLDHEGRVLGTIFAPPSVGPVPTRGEVAYNGNGGHMPGTFRVAGVIQSQATPQPLDSTRMRFYSDGQLIALGDQLTQTGDFFPSLQQTGGMLWQQVMVAGRPDAFKVDTHRLEAEWTEWFNALYESAFEVGRPDLLLPYLAHERLGEQLIGIDAGGIFRPATEDGELVPLVTDAIWTGGLATPASRTGCFFTDDRATGAQLDLARHFTRDAEGRPVAPPALVGTGRQRCVPWPPPELLLARYQRVDTAIIVPAVRALRAVQWDSLGDSVVCAYVRPHDLEGLPRHAAFADDKLRERCVAMREKLLTHDSIKYVDYETARLVDPKYAEMLREHGVPTTQAQRAAAIRSLAGRGVRPLDPSTPSSPRPPPTQGGIPFPVRPTRRGRDDRPKRKSGSAGVLLAGGAAVTGLALALGLGSRRRR